MAVAEPTTVSVVSTTKPRRRPFSLARIASQLQALPLWLILGFVVIFVILVS